MVREAPKLQTFVRGIGCNVPISTITVVPVAAARRRYGSTLLGCGSALTR